MVQMVAAIEAAHHEKLDRRADECRSRQRKRHRQQEGVRRIRQRGAEVGAHHVERAMRQIDEVHDAENERQP